MIPIIVLNFIVDKTTQRLSAFQIQAIAVLSCILNIP